MTARFVVLFDGRTGSTHLMKLLDSHPSILMKGEILGWSTHLGGQPEDQRATIAELFDNTRADLGAVGFKTKLQDVQDPDDFAALLESYDTRLIVLRRANEVKGAISTILGSALRARGGGSNITTGSQRVRKQAIDKRELDEMLTVRAARDKELLQFVERLPLQHVEVPYEELLLDETATLTTDRKSVV